MNRDSLSHEKREFVDRSYKDSPDMVASDNISIFDLHEDMKLVDAIPVEEMNRRVKTEGDELLELAKNISGKSNADNSY